MLIIPAIDIIQGRVVRLHQGDFNKEKFYSDDPVQTALTWEIKGAQFLHIVDLDGAKYGEAKNKRVITNIIKAVRIPCEVGGGLRNDRDIEYFLEEGASRVVLGTRALEDAGYLKKLAARFKDKIVVSVDFAGDRVVKKGWQEKMDLSPDAMIDKIRETGVKTIVITDITMDGTLMGPNIKKLRKILKSVDISIIASGGISSLEDIKRLKEIRSKRLEGIIVGRALYEGKFGLEEAIKAAG